MGNVESLATQPAAKAILRLVTRHCWLAAALMIVTADSVYGAVHHLPLIPSASDALRQGFVRIVNHSGQAGCVLIDAIDDTGRSFGSTSLCLGAHEAVHFNSNDLELGNPSKGMHLGIGGGQGDWRLILDSGLDIEPLAYVRTQDGFLATVHDLAPRDFDGHTYSYYVPIFNPGSNKNQVSSLRLINPGDADTEIEIIGRDDDGNQWRSSRVSIVVPAGESRTFSAEELEEGSNDFEGSLGDGTGKWRLLGESYSPVRIMSLMTSPAGHITNLSSQASSEQAVGIPLFLSTSNPLREGFARIVNRVGFTSGRVSIGAVDDSGRSFGPIDPRRNLELQITPLMPRAW